MIKNDLEYLDFAEERHKMLYRRNLIQKYCSIAERDLPTDKRLLFLMYYRHGYRCCEIAKLLGVHRITVIRRLDKISIYITNLIRDRKFFRYKIREAAKI